MTAARANEIMEAARTAAKGRCPWVDCIDAQLRSGEKQAINRAWDKLPGNSSFMSALFGIAQGKLTTD